MSRTSIGVKPDPNCPKCSGYGTVVVCGWCEQDELHSNCDDTLTYECGCRAPEYEEEENATP